MSVNRLPHFLLLLFQALAAATVAAASPSETMQKLFESEIYPLLTATHKGESCVTCHESTSTSDLVFMGSAKEDFQQLLHDGYLSGSGPDTLLGRVVTDNAKRRMPKKAPAWTDEQKDRLQAFVRKVEETGLAQMRSDEQFPIALLEPYQGDIRGGVDNQFLSYHQLRRKVETLIEPRGWRRGDRDLFEENVAMFQGADFKTRFNESTQASSTFLSALDRMSKDVVASAYLSGTGPFGSEGSGWEARVRHLYQHLLFRQPTPNEIQQASRLFDGLARHSSALQERDYELAFLLTVTDSATAQRVSREVRLPIRAQTKGAVQAWIDQSKGSSHTFAQPVRLRANDDSQYFHLTNEATRGNVSFAGLILQPANSEESVEITIDAEALEQSGAWERKKGKPRASLEDGNQSKGDSSLRVPLLVPKDGLYKITLHWREAETNTKAVFVEINLPANAEIHHAEPIPRPTPPKGQVHFTYDSSHDQRPYFQPEGSYRFGEHDRMGVEITNKDTHGIVTAGALEFVPKNSSEKPFLVDTKEAEGHEDWANFKSKSFGAYNQKGKSLSDEEKEKGALRLFYRPKVKAKEGWSPEMDYHLRLYYPGKRGHAQAVPFTIHASHSSPIVRVSHPLHAHAGAELRIDASTSYTAQRDPLHYHWQQLSGPPVDVDPHASQLRIRLPRWQAEDLAWQALARGLMRHPDFLFTRPPSVVTEQDAEAKRQLQLVKLAQDLLGRPPLAEERAALASGTSLLELTDRYLESQDFEEFYYHRIRLYLESQGTVVHDEPARLWCHIAFNDRPFQEILTADYTVDEQWQREERPAHHGKTGVLTTAGFIQGKPGLPHYNYAAQVSMLFLGYVYEVPAEIVEQREGVTAEGTTDPQSTCYSCHKILTPLAHQRNHWLDDGTFRPKTKKGKAINASDHGLVDEYPFKGDGLEAFATQAVKKERFVRTIIDTHFNFYFGRQMRYREDERTLYRRVWDAVHTDGFKIRTLIRTLVTSPEYLEGTPLPTAPVSLRHD